MEGNENGYTYKGHTFASERDMLRYLLDDYRCAEGFAAQYLAWIIHESQTRPWDSLHSVL